MFAFFRSGPMFRVELELEVRLDYQLGRLADLVQVLAHSGALIVDLNPDRSHYALGMGEPSTRVRIRVNDPVHRERVLLAVRGGGFRFQVLSRS